MEPELKVCVPKINALPDSFYTIVSYNILKKEKKERIIFKTTGLKQNFNCMFWLLVIGNL